MNETRAHWSPADHPYAVATTVSNLWYNAVALTAHRLNANPEPRLRSWDSRQIDAQIFIFVLSQLRRAADLMDAGLDALSKKIPTDEGIKTILDDACTGFDQALPDLRMIRNAQVHYDEWARGKGHGNQKEHIRNSKLPPREAAAKYWNFSYTPDTQIITSGPYNFSVDKAKEAAKALLQKLYQVSNDISICIAQAIYKDATEIFDAKGISYNIADSPVHIRVPDKVNVELCLQRSSTSNNADSPDSDIEKQIDAALTAKSFELKHLNTVYDPQAHPAQIQRFYITKAYVQEYF